MSGRVVFLLCLPAICFSFALFPNNGHETHRRQNDEENMVNVSSVAGGNVCYTQLSPCREMLSPVRNIEGLHRLVINGRLAVPCESNMREEIWNCIDSVTQCNDSGSYFGIRYPLMSWDFICQNSPAFVAGKDCWITPDLYTTIFNCVRNSNNAWPNILEESRSCINSARQCSDDDDFNKIILILQRIWDFLCQHSPEFVAGKGCWSSPELNTVTNSCDAPLGDTCFSTCIRESMANMTDCSPEESILLGNLAGVMMGETDGPC